MASDQAPQKPDKITKPGSDKNILPISGLLEIGHATRPLSVMLPIAAFLIAMTISSIVGITFYNQTLNLATSNNRDYLSEKNRQTKTAIQAIYKEHYDHLTLISELPALNRLIAKSSSLTDISKGRDFQDSAQQIKNVLSTRLIYRQFRLIDLNTSRVVLSLEKIENQVVQKTEVSFDKAVTNNIKAALTNTKEKLSAVLYSPITGIQNNELRETGENQYRITKLIYAGNSNEPIGALEMTISFGRFIELLKIIVLDDLDVLFANSNNDIIFRSHGWHRQQNAFTFKTSLDAYFDTNVELDGKGTAFIKSWLSNQSQSHDAIFQIFENESFGRSNQLRWLIQSNNEKMIELLKHIKNDSIILSLGLTLISLLLSLYAARKLTRPLSKMIEVMEQVETKSQLTELPVKDKGEIGVLARTLSNLWLNKQFKDRQIKENQFALDQHCIVSATDAQGVITFVNKNFIDICGYQEDEILGRDFSMFDSGLHDIEFHRNRLKTVRSGQVWKGEVSNKGKDGTIGWFSSTVVPFFDEQGNYEKTVFISSDITKLVDAEKAAADAIKSKSKFFASMSHEIRTPMNGVLGMLGLMMRTELNKQQKHYATLARSSADSLLAIIDDILDLSKIEAGKIELETIDFNLREQLGIFAESMAYRAQDKGLELILDVKGVESSMVKGDPSRVRQILSNIVGNAVKFTEKGEIAICANLTSLKDRKCWILKCSVRDTGIGIPADKIHELFDSYSQVDASTTRKFGGTGLGLAIIKQLTQLMNGRVWVESELGQGSTFFFEIELGVSQLSKQVAPKESIKGVQILVVDDNQTNVEVIVDQLIYWGASAVSASSAEQALTMMRQKSFDIAIVDMGMPEMDGAQLGTIIRENADYNATKLVMMTSMAGSGDISKFKNIGFNAYFPKPATTADLLHALKVLAEDGPLLDEFDGMVTNYNVRSMTSSHLFSNAKILLVEDNHVNQEVALGILGDMGVKTDVAENGKEALAALMESNNDYGLVIMDCQMPVMDGYQASKEIRSGKNTEIDKSIPIIAMTANALKGDREKCLKAGMDDYLTKPVDPNELEEKLRQWLPESQQSHSRTNDANKQKNQKMKTAEDQSEKDQLAKDQLAKDEIEDEKVVDKSVDESTGKSVNQSAKQLDTSTATEPVWDKQDLLKRVRNNKKLCDLLAALFVEELPSLFEQLKTSATNYDLTQVAADAHRIKGSSANLSAIRLKNAALAVELKAKENENCKPDDLHLLVDAMATEVNALLEELK